MHGLIGKIDAVPGKRDELAALLVEATQDMPGCLSYVVAHATDDENGLWVTEVWIDEAHHAASLSLPQVQAALTKGRPWITGFSMRTVTAPVGGMGL